MIHLLKRLADGIADLLPRGRLYWLFRLWAMSGDRGVCPHCGYLISHQENTVRRDGRPHHHLCACELEGVIAPRRPPAPAAELEAVSAKLNPCGHVFRGRADVEHVLGYVAREKRCPICGESVQQ